MSNEHADYLRGCFNDFSCAFNKDRHLAAAKALDALTTERDALRAVVEWIVQPDTPIGSNAEFALKARQKATAALTANGEGE